MKAIALLSLLVCLLVPVCAAGTATSTAPTPAPPGKNEELDHVVGVTGHYGGSLTIGQRAEPKTLNPVTESDSA